MEEERPRFRRDLDTRPLTVDGIAYVDATDPRSGEVFRFYDFEHAVAEVLDGRPLGDEVVSEARARTGFYLTAAQLAKFSEKLRALGFLEPGDDDATASGPAPAGMLDSAPAGPEVPELDDALAAAAIPPGSTEKLPVLGPVLGQTEKLPTLEQPVYEPEPPVEEPPAPELPAEEPPAPEPPAEEPPPPAGTEPSPVKEPPEEEKPPVKEPSRSAEPVDPALSPRAGELQTAPAASEEEAPPAAAKGLMVAPDEVEAALAGLPGSDEPTKSERRDDLIGESKAPDKGDLKSTLVGIGPEPRPQSPAKQPVLPAVAGPIPPSPFPPAVGLEGMPFPPAATPPPMAVPPPGLLKYPAPLAPTAEIKPLAPTAEVKPLARTAEVPALAETTEVHPLAASAEVPALVPATPRPSGRRLSPYIFAGAGVVLAALIGFFGYRLSATSDQGPLAVRTLVPTAGLIYRWFEATGTVKGGGGEQIVKFTTAGKVTKVLGAGASFQPGDVIAEVEGGAPQFKQAIEHNKQRLGYYEQRLAQMTQENNRPEIRQAELKIAEKKRLIAEAEANLSRQGVVATTSGQVAEALVTPGTVVKPGSPAVRTKGNELRAEFELSRDDANAVRHLGFCRIEVGGKPFDCSLTAEGCDETHVLLDLPADPEITPGKPVRLAKARYDAAFVLPASALAPTKGSDRRVYVVKDGRAESYAVILADQTPTEIVVTQGLEPGSAVIAEVPPALKPRAPVKATPVK